MRRADFVKIIVAGANANLKSLTTSFPIVVDKENRINIDLLLKNTKVAESPRFRFTRSIRTKRFNNLLKSYCRIDNKTKENVLVKKDGNWYLDHILSLCVAVEVNSGLVYSIYKNYMRSGTDDAVIKNLLTKLNVKSLEEIIKKFINPTRLKWSQFNVPFVYYTLYNKECVLIKASAVGIDSSEALIKALDKRIRGHRSSFMGYDF